MTIRKKHLDYIGFLIKKSITEGYYPGAVVMTAHQGKIIYQSAFGHRTLAPDTPMCIDTIFDAASLTKAVITTTAIMQLVESGRLELDAKIGEYWPKCGLHGKEQITIRQLLTHTSGLPALLPPWQIPEDPNQHYVYGLQQVEQTALLHPPGTQFLYGDINFIILGYLVELISGERLDHYAKQHILNPLKMTSSTFLPPEDWKNRIAPTCSPESSAIRWGQVNDPSAERMGGASGVAGLFTNAHDLGIFLQCLLDGGRIRGNEYLLSPLSILKMTTPQTPPEIQAVRGLGWDLDSPFSHRGVLLPVGSFGHSGWTGVSIWVDPHTQTWIIILTSRSYPKLPAVNQLIADRRAIANIVAASLTNIPPFSNTTPGELRYLKKSSSVTT